MSRYDAYIICTSPRSGSTLLTQLLRASGVAGYPRTPFHKGSVIDWARMKGIDVGPGVAPGARTRAAIAAARTAGKGETAVFGTRLQRHSFAPFVADMATAYPEGATDLARIEAAFGKTLFIHLTRPDKLAQAVSVVRATQTGLWHMAPDGREIERLAPPADPVFDAEAIRTEKDTFDAYDRDWRAWFRSEGISPLKVTYDALSDDPIGTLRHILKALGADATQADSVEVGVKKLADTLSAEWIARYQAEEGSA